MKFLFFLLLILQQNQTERTLMLDWFPNPDHVPIYVAMEKGFFKEEGLKIKLEIPSDPNDPLKLAAASRVDFAVSYEPNLIIARAEGLPVTAFGILVAHPLNTVMYLKESGIKRPVDLKGKRIGYSVSGFETAILKALLKEGNLELKDVILVNVNFNLVPSLLTRKVDAVVGAYRNYERIQLELEGKEVGMFLPEEHGVPFYYELIFITGEKNRRHLELLKSFKRAIMKSITFTKNNPEEAFRIFVSKNKDLNNKLNRMAFEATLPYFADTEEQDPKVYGDFIEFLYRMGVIKKKPDLNSIFINP